MRNLVKVKKIGKKYSFEWETALETDSKEVEVNALTSKDLPRPELDVAIKGMGKWLAKICEMNKTKDDIGIKEVAWIRKDKQPLKIQIKGDVTLSNGYELSLTSPQYAVYPEYEGELLTALQFLQNESWKYIDGDRAQQVLIEEAQDAISNSPYSQSEQIPA